MAIGGKGAAAGIDAPRYQQVAEDLLARLRAGEFPVGSMLPTEIALSAAYGVSRHTVREALSMLENMSMVRRLQGSGTSVASLVPADRFTQEVSDLEQLLQYPRNTRFIPLRAVSVEPGGEVAQRMQLPAGDWLMIDGIRRVKVTAAPICYATICLLAEFADVVELVGVTTEPVYDLIAEHHGIRIAEVELSITPVGVPEAKAELMDVAPGTPALLVARRYHDQFGRVFQVSQSVHPADRFTYQMHWRRAATPALGK